MSFVTIMLLISIVLSVVNVFLIILRIKGKSTNELLLQARAMLNDASTSLTNINNALTKTSIDLSNQIYRSTKLLETIDTNYKATMDNQKSQALNAGFTKTS